MAGRAVPFGIGWSRVGVCSRFAPRLRRLFASLRRRRRLRRLVLVRRRNGLERRVLNLALQGGGTHGAFTWGALDRLLEDRSITFDAISGTSAGAVNAVLLAAGLVEDGAAGALEKLARFWSGICRTPGGDSLAGGLIDALSPPELQRWQQAGLDLIGKFLAPAQFNPLDINPMRTLLRDLVDFERLRAEGPALFIAATDAATGRKRIFTQREISLESVMASACLPQLHQAVEIDGRHYWDGGYVANPPLLPLVQPARAEDTLLIQLIPLTEQDVPNDHAGIGEGLNRIIFNAPLRHEIATIALMASRKVPPFVRHRFHLIDATPATEGLPAGTRLVPDWRVVSRLRAAGREAAHCWLQDNRSLVGQRASADLVERFL